MTQQEIYTFVLCFIVLVLFTLTFSYLIVSNFKMHMSLIRLGQLDEQIKKEYNRKRNSLLDMANRIMSLILVLFVLGLFGFSLYINLQSESGEITTLKVVRSGSMQTANEMNTYLAENGIEDRLQLFDLVLIRPMPDEDKLKVYDIVVYEWNDMQIIHRIVEIEEPNMFHEETYYRLQGDANAWPDEYPVYYDQMCGFYQGERVAYIGSFVLFMQSPAGWLCSVLVLATYIATTIVEKKIKAAELKRLSLINIQEKIA